MAVQGRAFEFCPCGQPHDAKRDFAVSGSTSGLSNLTYLCVAGSCAEHRDFNGVPVLACRNCGTLYADMSVFGSADAAREGK